MVSVQVCAKKEYHVTVDKTQKRKRQVGESRNAKAFKVKVSAQRRCMCCPVPAVLPIYLLPISAETKQFPQATTHMAGVGVKPLRYMNIKLILTKSVASMIVYTNIWN